MKSPHEFEKEKGNETKTPGRVRVGVAYEDCEADQRAHHACQQILQAVHLDKVFSADFWKFDMFKLRAMRDAAAEEAARADLVVLAPNGIQFCLSRCGNGLKRAVGGAELPLQ